MSEIEFKIKIQSNHFNPVKLPVEKKTIPDSANRKNNKPKI